MPDTKIYWPFGSGFFDISLGADSELEVREVELHKFPSGSAIYYLDADSTGIGVRLHVEGSIVHTLASEFNVSEVCYHGDNIYEVTV